MPLGAWPGIDDYCSPECRDRGEAAFTAPESPRVAYEQLRAIDLYERRKDAECPIPPRRAIADDPEDA